MGIRLSSLRLESCEFDSRLPKLRKDCWGHITVCKTAAQAVGKAKLQEMSL